MQASRFFNFPNEVERRADGFLAALREDEIATVLSFMQARRFRAGEVAMREGEADRSLYVVTGGRLEVVAATPGGPRRLGVLQTGDVFGELAFFDGLPRSAEVRGMTDAETLVMSPAGFERLRLARPQLALAFALDLGRMLSLRFREVNRQLRAASTR